jgi:hypothetical protein
MNAILDERDAVAARAQAERQRGATQADAARAWERCLREREGSETPRSARVRWRDEEGL